MAFRFIGMAGLHQAVDHRYHFVDMIGGAGLHIRVQVHQGRHVLVEGVRRAFGNGADIFAAFLGGGIDLVINVGDVAHVGDCRVEAAQQPHEYIEDHHRAGVADVGVVIDRRPADIQAHVFIVQRDKFFFGAVERIVDLQGHGVISQSPRSAARGPSPRPHRRPPAPPRPAGPWRGAAGVRQCRRPIVRWTRCCRP